MNDITSSFGKSFLAAGFVPALVFIVVNDLVLLPAIRGGNHLYEIEFLGIKGGVYVSGGVVLGLLLLALNTLLRKVYETGFPLLRFRERVQNRYDHRYKGVRSRSREYAEATGHDKVAAKLILEKAYARLEEEEPIQQLPFSPELLKSTRYGNALAVMNEYPYNHYGMDAAIFWPRLIAVIPKEFKEEIADQTTTLDFLLNLSFLASLFGLEAVLGAFWLRNPWWLMYAGAGLIVGYGVYRAAVLTVHTLRNLVATSFDLFRHDLLQKYRVALPKTIEEEQATWQQLAWFARRSEPFYHPPFAPPSARTEPDDPSI